MTDWKGKTVAQWELINRLARRRFGERPLAEEAALAVMDGLLKDDWQRVSSYSGTASFTAYLATLTHRLLEDFARSRFGRVRPPGWLRALGGIWTQLFHFLCLERLEVTEAVEHVAQRCNDASREKIENAAWTIRQEVVDCGKHQGLEVRYEEGDIGDVPADQNSRQLRGLEETERSQIFRLLFEAIMGDEGRLEDSDLSALMQLDIHLESEEKLLLKLCFQDGITVTEAGRMLGYTRHQVHGRMRRLLARLRNEFEAAGLGPELTELLRD